MVSAHLINFLRPSYSGHCSLHNTGPQAVFLIVGVHVVGDDAMRYFCRGVFKDLDQILWKFQIASSILDSYLESYSICLAHMIPIGWLVLFICLFDEGWILWHLGFFRHSLEH